MSMTRSGTNYKQGDIVLIPFPFTDLLGDKKRPVLILSKNNDNEKDDDIISCAITSNPRKVRYAITITTDNLKSGYLPMESKIRINKIFTLEQSIILKIM